jgi:hypothetical protein
MEERFIEIRFYHWIKKAMLEFKLSYHILDVIDAYCLLGDIDSTLIKQLMQQIRKNSGPITTTKEETVYIARQVGWSYRDVQAMANISLSAQARLQEVFEWNNDTNLIKPCLNVEYHEAVVKFMRVVDILKGV